MRKQEREQYHSPRALIKGLCANYDRPTGACLIRGSGCPQITSGSLICRYFRDVLLEDPDSRQLKAEILSEDYIRTCEGCGQLFRAVLPNAKRCRRCSQAPENPM